MLVCRDFKELRATTVSSIPMYWAMGMFDGVHIGHVAVIEAAIKAARAFSGIPAVFTFSRHPFTCVHPGSVPHSISSDEKERLSLLDHLGVEMVLMPDFTPEVATMNPDEFMNTLCTACKVGGITVGEDWHFGKARSGNVETLKQLGLRHGFSVTVIPDVKLNDQRVSSTRIRQAIHEADFTSAATMLGRPYCLRGKIIKGRQLARLWNHPTANLRPNCELLPPLGVYAVKARVNGLEYGGVANLGLRPTVEEEGGELLLETHLFGLPGDIYGYQMEVEPLVFIRPEQQFPSLDALKAQIELDAKKAQELLKLPLKSQKRRI